MLYWIGIISVIYVLIFFIKRNWIPIIWLFLALISGFRYNVGTDYKAYLQMFIELVNGTATDGSAGMRHGATQCREWSQHG